MLLKLALKRIGTTFTKVLKRIGGEWGAFYEALLGRSNNREAAMQILGGVPFWNLCTRRESYLLAMPWVDIFPYHFPLNMAVLKDMFP